MSKNWLSSEEMIKQVWLGGAGYLGHNPLISNKKQKICTSLPSHLQKVWTSPTSHNFAMNLPRKIWMQNFRPHQIEDLYSYYMKHHFQTKMIIDPIQLPYCDICDKKAISHQRWIIFVEKKSFGLKLELWRKGRVDHHYSFLWSCCLEKT